MELCRPISIRAILDHEYTCAILLRLHAYSPHNLLEKFEALGCLYMVVTVLSH